MRTIKRIDDEYIPLIEADFKNGLRTIEIAQKYGFTRPQICYYFDKHRIKRDVQIQRNPRTGLYRLNVDDTAFDSITEESAYWIGFLMADGCVSDIKESSSPVIQINLKYTDIDHLEKFKKFLRSEHKIGTHVSQGYARGKTKFSRIAIRSKQLVEKLNSYGVVPRKTQKEKVIGLEYNKDFWRGVIDGDGSLGIRIYKNGRKEAKLTLCGSHDLCSQFHQFVLSIWPDYGGKVFYTKNIYAMRLCCNAAYKIIEILYGNASVYLDRKYKRATEILETCSINGIPTIIESVCSILKEHGPQSRDSMLGLIEPLIERKITKLNLACQLVRAKERGFLTFDRKLIYLNGTT